MENGNGWRYQLLLLALLFLSGCLGGYQPIERPSGVTVTFHGDFSELVYALENTSFDETLASATLIAKKGSEVKTKSLQLSASHTFTDSIFLTEGNWSLHLEASSSTQVLFEDQVALLVEAGKTFVVHFTPRLAKGNLDFRVDFSELGVDVEEATLVLGSRYDDLPDQRIPLSVSGKTGAAQVRDVPIGVWSVFVALRAPDATYTFRGSQGVSIKTQATVQIDILLGVYEETGFLILIIGETKGEGHYTNPWPKQPPDTPKGVHAVQRGESVVITWDRVHHTNKSDSHGTEYEEQVHYLVYRKLARPESHGFPTKILSKVTENLIENYYIDTDEEEQYLELGWQGGLTYTYYVQAYYQADNHFFYGALSEAAPVTLRICVVEGQEAALEELFASPHLASFDLLEKAGLLHIKTGEKRLISYRNALQLWVNRLEVHSLGSGYPYETLKEAFQEAIFAVNAQFCPLEFAISYLEDTSFVNIEAGTNLFFDARLAIPKLLEEALERFIYMHGPTAPGDLEWLPLSELVDLRIVTSSDESVISREGHARIAKTTNLVLELEPRVSPDVDFEIALRTKSVPVSVVASDAAAENSTLHFTFDKLRVPLTEKSPIYLAREKEVEVEFYLADRFGNPLRDRRASFVVATENQVLQGVLFGLAKSKVKEEGRRTLTPLNAGLRTDQNGKVTLFILARQEAQPLDVGFTFGLAVQDFPLQKTTWSSFWTPDFVSLKVPTITNLTLEKGYFTLPAALAEARSGDRLEAYQDILLEEDFEMKKAVTLRLNRYGVSGGKTLTFNAQGIALVDGVLRVPTTLLQDCSFKEITLDAGSILTIHDAQLTLHGDLILKEQARVQLKHKYSSLQGNGHTLKQDTLDYGLVLEETADVSRLTLDTSVLVKGEATLDQLKFLSQKKRVVDVEKDATFSSVEWNEHITLQVAENQTLTLKGTIKNGSPVVNKEGASTWLHPSASLTTGVDTTIVGFGPFAKDEENRPLTLQFSLKGSLQPRETILLEFPGLQLDNAPNSYWELLLGQVGQVDRLHVTVEVKDQALCYTVATARTLAPGSYTVSHLREGENQGIQRVVGEGGEKRGSITVWGITRAFTYKIEVPETP